jgi:hypothetical protein
VLFESVKKLRQDYEIHNYIDSTLKETILYGDEYETVDVLSDEMLCHTENNGTFSLHGFSCV